MASRTVGAPPRRFLARRWGAVPPYSHSPPAERRRIILVPRIIVFCFTVISVAAIFIGNARRAQSCFALPPDINSSSVATIPAPTFHYLWITITRGAGASKRRAWRWQHNERAAGAGGINTPARICDGRDSPAPRESCPWRAGGFVRTIAQRFGRHGSFEFCQFIVHARCSA